MSLHGNLADLPFVDLIEIASHRNQSCILHVGTLAGIPYLAATVIIQNGAVYAGWVFQKHGDTLTGLLAGEAALHALLVCPKGDFTIKILTSEYNYPARNVTKPIGEIVLANVFEAEMYQAYWQEQLTGWEIRLATSSNSNNSNSNSKELSATQASLTRPGFFEGQTYHEENTIRITRKVEITAQATHTRNQQYTSNHNAPLTTPTITGTARPVPRTDSVQPLQLASVAAGRVQPVVSTGTGTGTGAGNGLPKVQVQKGLISSLIAKIRSL